MSAARRLVADAMRAGVTFRLTGSRLRMVPRPGEKVPRELVARAKEMRANLISYLAVVPKASQPGAVAWDDAERIAASEVEMTKRRSIH